MSKPEKTTGNGTKISISTDGSTFTEFGSVTKASAPSMKRGTIDVTDLNSYSNNNQMKESIPGWIEPEEMSLEGYLKKTDTAMTTVETAFWAGDLCTIKIELPEVIGKTITYYGFISQYQSIGDIDAETPLGYKMGFTITQKPTVA